MICGISQGQKFRLDKSSKEAVDSKREIWGNGVANNRKMIAKTITKENDSASDDISFLWETEVMGIEPYVRERDGADEEELNAFFRETVKRKATGRYVIHLPFKPNMGTLGTNWRLTLIRLKTLVMQAKKESGMLEAIDKEIGDLLNQGFVELSEAPGPDEDAHYLPLLAVKKAGSTPDNLKLRLVNDAAARTKGEASLNDCLSTGPNLIAPLLQALLRFRQLQIAICADVEKAYLQNEIVPEHRTFLRFLGNIERSDGTDEGI